MHSMARMDMCSTFSTTAFQNTRTRTREYGNGESSKIKSLNNVQKRKTQQSGMDMDTADKENSMDMSQNFSNVSEDKEQSDKKINSGLIEPESYMLGTEQRRRNLEQIIMRNLYKKEITTKLTYSPDAMYVQYRHLLVEWMAEVCEEYNLPMVICHLSIRYLDEVLGREKVAKKNLQLIALCCIMIAAKYREPEVTIPTVDELNECSDFAYSAEKIKEMEMVVLKMLKWTLGYPTVQDFVMYFLKHPMLYSEDRLRSSMKFVTARENTLLLKYIKFFGELSILDYSMQQYPPSILAAATICCSRIAVGLCHEWNDQLEKLTGYNLNKIRSCKEHLFGIFLKKYPEKAAKYNYKKIS